MIYHTMQSGWVAMRSAEVTVADGTLDGTTSGSTYYDLSSRDFWQVGPEANHMEIFFAGEATDNASAAAKIYIQGDGPPAHRICDITIRAGTAFFKGKLPRTLTATDTSTYLIADTVVVDGSNSYYADVSAYDQSVGGVSMLHFPVRGNAKIYIEFKNIAGANQFTRITPYGRSW